MSARELVVLGTASQAPTRTRNHNGYLLRWDGDAVLFDPGEGTQRQVVHAGVSVTRVGRICVTHAHNDHCLGLPGVLARMHLEGVTRRVPVHGPAAATDHLRALVGVAAVDLDVEVLPCDPPPGGDVEVAVVGGARLAARYLDHRVPAVGYRLDEPQRRGFVPELLAAAGISGPEVKLLAERGELRGVRADDVSERRRGQSFAFVMDTRLCPAVAELARDADMLVCESTFLDRDADLAQRYAHMTAREAATVAATAGVRRLVLTHFSQRYTDPAEFLAEATRAVADAGGHTEVVVAGDLDVVEVPPRR
ncbi:ribonuclease Z [Kineococcus xinjiangensis]|uniref:Ribonuclease Z n=1 Tax=Kineococcus xinjiangensis TaxID=512762 RepID=A0A2S6IUY7_9ACTN|nr:MBL fold metallo-hydrolase [Kineococcus xinjiangensis]PPK97999.1 ribonuclease Z [Kineococcus xinjiangensis]